jgi:hypothetical protein
MSPEESIYRSIDVFERLAKTPQDPIRSQATGLALLAEGLHANIQKMDKRLSAIEVEMRSRPSR